MLTRGATQGRRACALQGHRSLESGHSTGGIQSTQRFHRAAQGVCALQGRGHTSRAFRAQSELAEREAGGVCAARTGQDTERESSQHRVCALQATAGGTRRSELDLIQV